MKKRFLIITMVILGLFAFMGLSACNLRSGEHQHSFSSDWSRDAVYHWHAANCEHRNEIDGKERHTFNGENRCTVCNYLLRETNGLAYELNEDEASYTVTGYGNVKSTDIIIPALYDGRPVTRIKERAFVGYSKLKNIIIPDTVYYVGDDAFLGCNSLVYNEYNNAYYIGSNSNLYLILIKAKDNSIPSCTISDKTKYVCSKAFKDCVNLRNFVIPETVEDFGKYVFSGSGLTQITIPDTFEYIDEGFFSGCPNLKDVTISNNVKTIKSLAFSDCPSLGSLDFTDNLESVEEDAFYNSGIENFKVSGTEVDINSLAFRKCKIKTADLSISRLGIIDLTLVSNLIVGGGDIDANKFKDSTELTSVTLKSDVQKIGNNAFEGCTKLTEVTFAEGFSELGDNAFKDCAALEKVVFPNSISKVGVSVFSGCNNLQYRNYSNGLYLGTAINPYLVFVKPVNTRVTNCNINDNTKVLEEKAFAECVSLNNLTLGRSLTRIGEYMFQGCTSLTDLVIPDGITRIEPYAFDGCTGLVEISLPNTLDFITKTSFNGCENLRYQGTTNKYLGNEENPYLVLISVDTGSNRLVINDATKIISDSACMGCTKLTSIDLKKITQIGDYAFSGSGLQQTLNIPNTVTHIGKGAFSQCTNLSTVNIRASLNELPEEAFMGCSNLKMVNFPGTVETIGKNAFLECRLLKDLKLADGLKVIESAAFKNCRALTSVELPDSVTFLGDEAFSTCQEISSLKLSRDLKEIGERAFYHCDEILEIAFPENLTSIGSSAFSSCYGLTSVELPDSVTFLGEGAFQGCYDLQSVKLPKGLTEINASTFYACEDLSEIIWPEKLTTIRKRAFVRSAFIELRIPEGVTTIEDDVLMAPRNNPIAVYLPSTLKTIGNAFNAFADSSTIYYFSIKNIYYNGTREQWAMVDSSLPSYANNCLRCLDDLSETEREEVWGTASKPQE